MTLTQFFLFLFLFAAPLVLMLALVTAMLIIRAPFWAVSNVLRILVAFTIGQVTSFTAKARAWAERRA